MSAHESARPTPANTSPAEGTALTRSGAARARWWPWALVSSAATAAILGLAMHRFIATYRLVGDDFALVLNSSTPYVRLSQWPEWFTQGYSHYFNSYPDWPHTLGTDYSRPLVNLLYHAVSRLHPSTDAAYLVLNYLIIIALAFVVTGLAVRGGRVRPFTGALAGVAVSLSPVHYFALFSASFITNPLALLLVAIAFLLLMLEEGAPATGRLVGAVALLTLAVASHETAVLASIAAAALCWWRARPRTTSEHLRAVVPFAIPWLYLGIERLVLTSTGSSYATAKLAEQLPSALLRVLASPALPYEFSRLTAEYAQMSSGRLSAFLLAIAANIVLAVVVIRGTVRSWRSYVPLWIIYFVALLPALVMPEETRFLGFVAVVAAVLVMRVVNDTLGTAWVNVAVALLLVSNGALFIEAAVRDQQQSIDRSIQAGRLFDSAHGAIVDARPSAVVLVNDASSGAAARSMLELAAWPAHDIRLIVENNLVGTPSVESSESIRLEGDDVVIENRLGGDERNAFVGSAPFLTAPNQGLVYEPIPESPDPGRALRARLPRPPGGVLVVGVDPRTGEAMKPKLF